MKIFLPNMGSLQSFDNFLKRFDGTDNSYLEFSMHPKWVFVHPAALAFTACVATYVKECGGGIVGKISDARSLPYFIRMGLFNFVDLPYTTSIEHHEESGRFVPVKQVKTARELEEFIVNVIPLLHAPPAIVEPVKYVLNELVWNVMEHAKSKLGAFVCAQWRQSKRTISIGVADSGIGIRESLMRHHRVPTHLGAIYRALIPGLSGTSPNIGGTGQNAGAGLFFIKTLARLSFNYFLLYSGNSMYKLCAPHAMPMRLYSNPTRDPHTFRTDLGYWPGTLVGFDLTFSEGFNWPFLMERLRETFGQSVFAPAQETRRPNFE